MLERAAIKPLLKSSGLLPMARHVYRRLSPTMRRQRNREIAFYSNVLKRGDLCFDIGACLGGKTEIFREIGARVVLVEPNPNCYENLNFYFRHVPDVEMIRAATGSTEGTITLYANGTGAAASVLPDWNKKLFGQDYQTTPTKVAMTTLDRLIEKFGRPDYIKIDVEGFEEEVIRGLSSRVPILSFEFFHDNPAMILNCLMMLQKFGQLRVRYADMDCNWLTPSTTDVGMAIADIKARKLDGDIFVWIT